MMNNTLSHYFKTLAGTGQSSGSPDHKAPSRGIHLTSVIALVSAAAIALSGATVPVPSQADESGWNNNITASGSMHPVQLQSLTDDTNDVKVPDTGVATYVGGNMYIGSPSSTTWSHDSINGSYAAEAEGQTVVKGDLLARPIKMGSDGRPFFTLGMVAFGTQYLPAAGTTILAVGGTEGAISTLGGGNDDHAQAWNAPVGIKSKDTNTSKEYDYKAYIAGKQSTVWGDFSTPSVKAYTSTASNAVTWSGTTGLKDSGITGAQNYDSKIAKLSSDLSRMPANGIVTPGVAPTGSYTRYKYDSSRSYGMTFSNDSVKYTVGSQAYSGINNERVLYFSGDGHSDNQVFNVTLSQLKSDGYRGLDFAFSNIPANASVIINVVKDNGSSLASTDAVSFNTGWRFWWNNDEISNGYVTSGEHAVDSSIRKAYATAGESIMWNFGNAGSVKIGGGKAYEGLKTAGGFDNNASLDDPAAAMLGSILLASGSFDDHVTTNGRVWVGGDFMMNNPTGNANGASTASVIDMDQERHNLPWYGSYFNDASMLEWGKASLGSKSQLGGSTWSIYGTPDDAKNRKNAIATVTDNGFNDYAPKEGEIAVHWLQPNANYYIVETNPPAGYKRSTNIYTAQTTNTGYSMNTLTSRVYDSSGNQIDDNADTATRQLDKTAFSDGTSGYSVLDVIGNASVIWAKYSSEDQSKTGLPGSEWTLTNTKTNASWTVSDNTAPATAVTITKANGSVVKDEEYIGAYQSLALAAKVAPSQANQRVIWKSSDDNVAVVSDGVVTGTGGGSATITACAESTPGICASLKVTVGTVNVSLLRVYSALDADKAVVQVSGNPEAALSSTGSMEMFTGTHVQIGAVVEPSITKPVFTSLDPSIVSVDSNGVVTAKKSGETTIVVRAGNKTARVHVSVSDHNMNKDGTLADTYIIYFHKGSGTWYGSRQGSDGSWSDGAWTDDTWNTNDVYLRYQSGEYDWETVGMKPAACNKDYMYTVLEKWQHNGGTYWSLDRIGGEFLFTNRRQNVWYKQKHDGHTYTYDGKPVYFNFSYEDYRTPMSPAITVKDSERLNEAPLGCPTQTTLDMLDATVLRTWPLDSSPSAPNDTSPAGITPIPGQGTDSNMGITDASSSSSDGNVLADVDPAVGSFTVAGLQDGDYTLKEKTSPTGFTLSPKGYSFTVKSGKVTWSDTVQSHIVDGRLFVADSPTQATWYKTDADAKGKHSRLGGSQWRITSSDGKTGYCIADGSAVIDQSVCAGKELKDYAKADGVLTVKGIPAGYYTLQEVVAPANYRLSNETYSLVISADSSSTLTQTVIDPSTGAQTQQAVHSNEVQDKRQLGSVQWNKTDEHGAKLSGSGWKLTFVPQGGTRADAETRDVVDWDTSSGERPAECNSDAEAMPWNCDTAGEAGVFSLTNLPWGTYALTETKVPAGHTALDKTTVSFTISPKSMHPDLGDIVNKTTPVIKSSEAENKVSMTKLAQTGLPSDIMMLLLLSTALVACGIAIFASQRALKRRSK